MKSKLVIALVASVVGVVAGVMGSNLVKPAYAAPTVIKLSTYTDMMTKCDFSKTVVVGVGSGVYCAQK